jgi:hypothetical protein
METQIFEQYFTAKRLSTYYKLFKNNKEKAIDYYKYNIQISEALYPVLSICEVAMRNAIHKSCSKHFGKANWIDDIKDSDIERQIDKTRDKVKAMYRTEDVDAVIAELTFGFWTALFNKEHAAKLWKPLLHAFPVIPIEFKNRQKMSVKLNDIRKFRNRVFHFEPINIKPSMLLKNYNSLKDIIRYIDPQLEKFTDELCNFETIFNEMNNKYKL